MIIGPAPEVTMKKVIAGSIGSGIVGLWTASRLSRRRGKKLREIENGNLQYQ